MLQVLPERELPSRHSQDIFSPFRRLLRVSQRKCKFFVGLGVISIIQKFAEVDGYALAIEVEIVRAVARHAVIFLYG